MKEMRYQKDLKMWIWCISKLIVISITMIGCFGLVGSLVNLNSQHTNKKDKNEIMPQDYTSKYMQQLSQSPLPSDLETNSSFMYTVIVSPDYEIDENNDPYFSYEYEIPYENHYDISQRHKDYTYYDYEYEDIKPIVIVKSRRRMPNRHRIATFRHQRPKFWKKFRNRYRFRNNRKRINERQRMYKSKFRRRKLASPIISLKRRLTTRRQMPILQNRRYVDAMPLREKYPIYFDLNNNKKSYHDHYNTPPMFTESNRRHQNYQNSIITGSKSSGGDLTLLGLFGLLQLLGIIFNVGLAHFAFNGFGKKGSSWYSSYGSYGNWLWPFNNYGGQNGFGSGIFNPFSWFGYHNNGYYNSHPTNAVINFVVSNTVEAGATATATNNNQDNDNISNTATNAGGRKRRKRRSYLKRIDHNLPITNELAYHVLNGTNSTLPKLSFNKNYQAPTSNVTFNFVVSNSVSAPATAMASNTNSDNDMITNSAMNAGGKRRKRRTAPAISNDPFHKTKQVIIPTKVFQNNFNTKIEFARTHSKIHKSSKERTFGVGVVPLIGLVILNTIVFLALVGYIAFVEFNTSSLVTDQSKDISIIPNSITFPNITSTNMTSSVVESMETVVTSNTNEDNDVISNVCNNNGVIIMSALPVNLCVNAGRALINNFVSREVLQNIYHLIVYKGLSNNVETGIENPNSNDLRELENDIVSRLTTNNT